MLDNKFVEEYKKIKPTDELKTRIFYSVVEAEQKNERKAWYLRMRPVLSGALACVLLVCCITFIPFDFLETGDISVAYAQSGEFIAPSSSVGRSYGISMCSDVYYEYDKMPNGCKGAEFTFELGGNTKISTEYGCLYLKNGDGTYEKLGQSAKVDGVVTLFWEMPTEELDKECLLTLKNRSGMLNLSLERFEEEYKANLVLAE